MTCTRIQSGATEPIQVFVLDRAGEPLTGKTDLYIRIRRGNGDYLDWDDMTFDPAVWVRLDEPLVEVDATLAPGIYEVVGGLDTGAITNPNADDNLVIIPVQDPGDDAVLPLPGELKVGQWVDDLEDIKGIGFAPNTHSLVNIVADVAVVPVGVWDTVLTGYEGDFVAAGGMVNLGRQGMTNRQEEAPGTPGTYIIWKDGSVNELGRFYLRDAAGGAVVATVGSPSRRTAMV